MWLGSEHPKTTEIYLRATPAEKLEILDSNSPPAVEPGNFIGVQDRLMSILNEIWQVEIMPSEKGKNRGIKRCLLITRHYFPLGITGGNLSGTCRSLPNGSSAFSKVSVDRLPHYPFRGLLNDYWRPTSMVAESSKTALLLKCFKSCFTSMIRFSRLQSERKFFR